MQIKKREVVNLILYFLLWVLLAWVDRLFFILLNASKLHTTGLPDYISMFIHGFKLDISLAAYVCALPALVYLASQFFAIRRISKLLLDIYTGFFILAFALVSVINFNIYREWGNKISKRVLDTFLETPKEALSSTANSPWFLTFFVFLILIIFGWTYYRKTIQEAVVAKRPWYYNLVHSFVILLLLFTFIRGGYGRAVLNPSMAYYSNISIHNHAAVNTHWAFIKELVSRNEGKNPYLYFEEGDARSKIEPLLGSQGENEKFLEFDDSPNVVLIILEGFVADLIASLGGETGITPQFEKLVAEGLLFEEAYASSDRSDKGIISIFSGFPSQGDESIIKYIPKHEKLPSITQKFHALGYQTSFYYGGQSEFYNFKSFMLSHDVHKVVDQSDFKPGDIKSSWGVYDDLIFERLITDLNKEEQPFFSSVFTLTNHEPFELEGTYQFGEKSAADKFRSTAYYTDSVLNEFINHAKEQDWYKNTLFVLVADHGHRLPAEKWELDMPERYHIPLLFFGDVIAEEYRGKVISKICNQSDLPAILLNQLGFSSEDFPWSRDVMGRDYEAYAFFTARGVFGIKSQDQSIGYSSEGKVITYQANNKYTEEQNSELLDTAKAYYQLVYEQFLKY